MLTRTFVCGMASAAMLALLSVGPVSAQQLTIGSMPVGSGWYVAAAVLEKHIEDALEGVDVEILARGGGVANPLVVQGGTADIALSNVATSAWAFNGELLYEGQEAPDIRSLVGGLNSVYLGALVRTRYMQENGFSTLEDVLTSDRPLVVMMKPPGSNIPPAVDIVLEAHGTSLDDIRGRGGNVIQVDSSQMSALLRDGRVDVFFDSILRGHPTIQEVSLTGGVEFLDLSDEARDALAARGLAPGDIPEWFDNQTGVVKAADFGTHLIAHADLDEELAYRITQTVVENMSEMIAEYPAFAGFDPAKAALPESNGIPLHPGAERYYRDAGLLPGATTSN